MDRRTAVKNIALSLGLVVSSSTVITLLNSCGEKNTITPEFFKIADRYIIDFLIDIILPVTSTMGAKDLNISQFIDKMCHYVLNEEQQAEISFGLVEFSSQFQQNTGKLPSEGNKEDYQLMVKTYFDISEKEEMAVFKLLNSDYNNLSRSLKPNYNLYKFLTTVRELSLLGYFTSEIVMKNA